MTDADFKGMHDGHPEFDLSFSGRIDDSKFYDFNAAELSDAAGFAMHFPTTRMTPRDQ